MTSLDFDGRRVGLRASVTALHTDEARTETAYTYSPRSPLSLAPNVPGAVIGSWVRFFCGRFCPSEPGPFLA
jgi:hypothetical protein